MNILEALEEQNVGYKSDPSKADEIWLCCPFCEDTSYRFGLNVRSGLAHCFHKSCDFKSRSKEYTFKRLREALRLGLFSAVKNKNKKKKTELIHPDDFRLLWPPPKDYWGKKAYEYQRSRGTSNRQIREHQIGFTTVGFYSYRIVAPVAYHGKVYAYQGRTFVNSELKYKNSAGRKVLYNVPDKTSNTLVLTEGIYDCLSVERGTRNLGIDVAAIQGSALSPFQTKQIKPYKNIILWPDPDKGGIEGFLNTVAKPLRQKYPKKKLFLVFREGDPDPSDLNHKQVQQRVRKAKLLTEGYEQKLRNIAAFEE